MEMDEGKTSRDMSKLISNKADILQRNSMKMCREKKREILSSNQFTPHLYWCVLRKFIAKHFFISIFIQATNN